MAETFVFSGKQTIELIRTLIRYDIPILLLGKSSIGKSYSIIEMSKYFRIPTRMLYIGSEKPEHIEGLPKLTGTAAEVEILQYYKPYWFPVAKLITEYVSNGKRLFEDFAANYYTSKFSYRYSVLSQIFELLSDTDWGTNETLKEITLISRGKIGDKEEILNKPFKVERSLEQDQTARDDIRDICVYLTTLLGYGNFWLILDEIDKVEARDIDKYAPLLHIVRERWLKNWRLRDLNEGKGIDITTVAKNSDYSKTKDIIENDLKNNRSVLDTRIIAIANKTKNIEEALFRRFVQLIMEDLVVFKTPPKNQEEIKQCIESEVSPIEGEELIKDLRVQRIKEVNLQWTYNFFFKIANKEDEGNFIRNNYLEVIREIAIDPTKDPEQYDLQRKETGKKSALHKIIRDNFEGAALIDSTFRCIANRMDIRKQKVILTPIELAKQHLVDMTEKGYTIQEMKDEILETVAGSYPVTARDKLSELKTWASQATTYLEATMLDEKGKFAQHEVNQLLVPALTKLVYEKMILDNTLNTDNIRSVMQQLSVFWNKITGVIGGNIGSIKIDVAESQKAILGDTKENLKDLKPAERIKLSENALMGAGEIIRNEEEATEAYRKSLSYKLSQKQSTDSLKTLIGKSITKLNSWKEYPNLIKFIKENHIEQLNQFVDALKKSANANHQKAAVLVEQFIKTI